ncbi:beta-galactosidase [Rathayibacter sp. VKM Ac-2759]|uniref:beta-galactosidase n=1 Tax=Rathayibacter sp. VKM Ac-2759 TaxID=2609252 RepID=UPI001ABE5464|nr:beta-galactosidase [Rathayibacter sp. VKM Ac-2759]
MALKYGGDYNPEQWPEEVWAEDVRLMSEAGVNFVTVGVFSWALLEPEEGRYDFGWLDRVLDLLHGAGIGVDLATATASPPPWLFAAHPEILPEDERGVRRWPGSRQHYSPTSPAYRAHAARLVRAMAERYGAHPALVMWHINNEYGCHTNLDYSDDAARAFRVWLEARYGGIDALNAAWGTAFWSQHYTSFEQILPPRIAPNFRNPTQLLDFRRFSSDALLECFLMEKAIVREISPDVPVTTNFIGAFEPLDYWRWAPHLDVISDDNYYDPFDESSPMKAAFSRDLMRSLGGGRPWLLMEQATSHVQWRTTNARKPTGQMRSMSLQALARGADGINFFQWRQSVSGAEKFHSAMLPHGGTDTRIWRDVVELGDALSRLGAVEGVRSRSEVAIVLDWDSRWAMEAGAHAQTFDYLAGVESWYRGLYARNVPVDFVPPSADLSGYRVVIAPQLYVLSVEDAARLERFAAEGGVLLVGYYSGIVDEVERIHDGGYPGPLGQVLGVRVEEFAPLLLEGAVDSTVVVDGLELGAFVGTVWSEIVVPTTATVLAGFVGGDLDGLPAVTRRAHGSGAAWYVATQPSPEGVDLLLDAVLTAASVIVPPAAPAGVEIVRRGDLLFVINQGSAPVDVPLEGWGVDSAVQLPPYGTAVLEAGAPVIASSAAARSTLVE